jgi:kumamolisin
MNKRFLSSGLTALSILSILMLTLSSVQARGNVSAATPPPKTFAGNIPSAVTSGQARLIGHPPGTDQLALAIGLPLRNQKVLTQLLYEVSTPRNPHYGQYLTQAQANQAFNPTAQQEQQVIGWLQAHGLTVTHTYPNHLLVDVTGTFAQIEQLFHVTINDFTMQHEGKQITFYAPTNEPTVDGSVGSIVDSIVGLDDFPSFHVDDALTPTYPADNGKANGSPPYYPQDFANAYDVKPLWNAGDTGVGQHIGIVLWGPPPSSAALQQFDAQTGATPPNLQPILVKGGSKYPVSPDGAKEAAMDVETTSGMAPGATINYYEAPDTLKGNATASGLEAALNMAGTDPINNQQISNSWHRECEPTQEDAFIKATEQILLSNSVTGHNYLFSSGDSGSSCGGTNPLAQYPATSAYVTSVGGTHFSKNIAGGYRQETAWSGSGGGYSILFPEPDWQANASIPDPNAMRGLPDVAADAAQSTGAFICYDSSNGPTCTTSGDPQSYGRGTSLATPLWAGMIADVNQYVQSQNELPLGFINPLLYAMHTGMLYTAYHDIVNGKNGKYKAELGWDAVTGLGSPDLYNLARDAAILDALPHSLTPINLDTNGCFFTPLGISDSGIVGGNSQCTNEAYSNAAIWQSGSDTQFFEPPSAQHVAQGMSSTGDIVGYYQLNSSQLQFHAVKWASNGTPTDLGGPTSGTCDPNTGSTTATAANDVGEVAGYCWNSNNTYIYAGYWPGGAPNSFTKLPDISNAIGSDWVYGINHSGSIVGVSQAYDPTPPYTIRTHAVLWQNGTAQDISPPGATGSTVAAINDNNLAVGTVYFDTDLYNHAYVWDLANNNTYDLYALTGHSTNAYAVNNSGVVVGTYYVPYNGYTSNRAFMWKAGFGFVDLNYLLAANSGWILASADGINSSGQIVGLGYINGVPQHYLLNTSAGKTPLVFIPGVMTSKFAVIGSQPIDPIVEQTLSQVSNNTKRSRMRSKS